jgi:hypothetical protein
MGVVPFQANPIFGAPVLVSAAESPLQQPPCPAQLIEGLMMVAIPVKGPHGFGERLATSISGLGRRHRLPPGARGESIGPAQAIV